MDSYTFRRFETGEEGMVKGRARRGGNAKKICRIHRIQYVSMCQFKNIG